MIDSISRYISTISLAVVAALSIFNIGYFWKIGLHFIGLVDLSNLVYSAGLALSAIFVLLTVALGALPRQPALWKIIVAVIVGVALSIWGTWKISPRTLDPQLIENGTILVGLGITASAAIAWGLLRYRVTQVWDSRDLGLIFVLSFVTIFQVGMFSAALELSDRATYTVTTKGGEVFQNSHILRSASAGFILAIEGQVVFVPQAEISSVKSVGVEKP